VDDLADAARAAAAPLPQQLPHPGAIARIRHLAEDVCARHTDPTSGEKVPVLAHAMAVDAYESWCGAHDVDPVDQLIWAAAAAAHRSADVQHDRCALLDVAQPMTKHLRASLPSWAVHAVRVGVLDVATADEPAEPLELIVPDGEPHDELCTALLAWIAAIGCAHGAVNELAPGESFARLLPLTSER